ncbi:MAG: hypothetical protein IJI22_02640 [Bacilli bacterium]|nr:hypothetical protein [Bacilli bacterium]
MPRIEEDKYYQRISKKIETGEFVPGQSYKFNNYINAKSIYELPLSERTPENCSFLMGYCRCKLSDVPFTSMTREFFLNSFNNDDVYNYISANIREFDRQFFKDLIETNNYSLSFDDKNCFEIMPLEYIDEEMCSLATINSTDWSSDGWLMSVIKRKKEALSSDLWHLAVRLYGLNEEYIEDFIKETPEEYRDRDYYLQMCSSNFNCGVAIYARKEHIMESVPKEHLDNRFYAELIERDNESIITFTNEALETIIDGEPLWKKLIQTNGRTINYLDLNDERIAYFLSLYSKDSPEYFSFKFRYRDYLSKKNKKEYERKQKRIQEEIDDSVFSTLERMVLYDKVGLYSSMAIADEIDKSRQPNESLLPIWYHRRVPRDLAKEYDSEEYLVYLYKNLGIEIIEEEDYYFYRVILPEGWTVENDGNQYQVKDQDGNIMIEYYDNNKFYDRYIDITFIKEKEPPKKYKK